MNISNNKFQNYVILDSNKTSVMYEKKLPLFQNYVILDSNKTKYTFYVRMHLFQNYVILDSNKTYMLTVAGWVTVLELCYFRQ